MKARVCAKACVKAWASLAGRVKDSLTSRRRVSVSGTACLLSELKTLVGRIERDVKLLESSMIRPSIEMTLLQERLIRLVDETKARESAVSITLASVVHQMTMVHAKIVEMERYDTRALERVGGMRAWPRVFAQVHTFHHDHCIHSHDRQ